MCGIFGIWQVDGKSVDLAMARQATTTLRHRGPDDEGYLLVNTQTNRNVVCGGSDTNPDLKLPAIDSFYGDSFNLAFGFRRLAILDLSSAGHQPMMRDHGRFWIVFNGEIYNYLELRAELTGYGHDFQTGTDTEVILAAYQQWGPECLERFNGMWAFALWDHQEQRLFIARDRFGIKPLYYINDSQKFTFASEIKALVGQHGLRFEPDDQAIYRYLVGGVLPSSQQGQTFFKGVQSLPPGHWMAIQSGNLTMRRYWLLSTTTNGLSGHDPVDLVEQYRELLIDSVQLRLRSDVPVGTCLSGGLDSSSIVCIINQSMAGEGLATEQLGSRQKTFSAVYETAGRYNERDYIERVLQATQADGHFVFPAGERLHNDLKRLIWHQDEPFPTTSIFAQWCVMNMARECGIIVLLDGQGADELLGGYRPFTQFLGDLIRRAKIARVLAEARAIQRHTGLSMSYLLIRALAWQFPSYWADILRRQYAKSQIDLAVLNRDFVAQRTPETIVDWRPWIDHYTLERHLQNLVRETTLPDLLRFEDRNSMAFSVEARVPYLDYRLVQFAFGEASCWRIHQGWTKWPLRQAMVGLVPDEIVWRKEKVGFETPEADWIRQWLHSEPDLFNNDALSREYLELGTVRKRLASWLEMGGDTKPIWRWINLELWLRVWCMV